MRVGLVTTWAECGAGHVSLAYARGLSALGCDVGIYSRGQYLRAQRWGRADERPWPLEFDRCRNGLTQVNQAQFHHWLSRFSPDWLIFNEQRAWAPVLQARSMGIKCAAYVDYYRADNTELFELYDLLICHTNRHYEVFSGDPRAQLIHWGVDVDHFSPGDRQLQASALAEPLVVVHSAGMGGPSDRKGTDLVLQSFHATKGDATLRVHTQLPKVHWPKAWHEVLVREPRIQMLTGPLNPLDLYRSGDLYLYPSRLEGIGLTLPESLACGLSAIATATPPMDEFVAEGVNGSLVPVRQYRGRSDGYFWPEAWLDIVDLRDCLQRYINQPSLARQQGRSARELMVAQRNWTTQVLQIHQALQMGSVRPLAKKRLAELSTKARFQDRVHEPRVVDGLLLMLRCLINALRQFLPQEN